MGAATNTIREHSIIGNKRATFGTLTFSTSYATNGETFTVAGFGLSTLDMLDLCEGTGAGRVPEWDRANNKIKLFQQSAATGALTEVVNTNNVSGVSIDYIAYGV